MVPDLMGFSVLLESTHRGFWRIFTFPPLVDHHAHLFNCDTHSVIINSSLSSRYALILYLFYCQTGNYSIKRITRWINTEPFCARFVASNSNQLLLNALVMPSDKLMEWVEEREREREMMMMMMAALVGRIWHWFAFGPPLPVPPSSLWGCARV